MVDFSLTDADKRLIEMQRRENDLGRKYARELDRISEDRQPEVRGTHADVAGTEDPEEALEHAVGQTSGKFITEALMVMASAKDADLRDKGEAFGSWLVQDYGTDAQKKKYGHLRLAIGITEPGAGSDPGNMRTNAKYDVATDEYVLNGEKTFISFINKFDGAVTLLRGEPDEKGRPQFMTMIVLKGQDGMIEVPQMKKLGIRKHDLGGFILDNCRVPADARLDADFGKTMSKFNHNRPIVSATALAICRSLLDFTHARLAESGIEVDYAKGLSARSAVEDKLIRLEALWEATWGTIMRAKWLQQLHGSESNDYRVEVSIAKALGGKASRLIPQGCLEILGPEGLSEDYLAEKWYRDARIADIYEGAGEIQRILIARPLFGYKKGELN